MLGIEDATTDPTAGKCRAITLAYANVNRADCVSLDFTVRRASTSDRLSRSGRAGGLRI